MDFQKNHQTLSLLGAFIEWNRSIEVSLPGTKRFTISVFLAISMTHDAQKVLLQLLFQEKVKKDVKFLTT